MTAGQWPANASRTSSVTDRSSALLPETNSHGTTTPAIGRIRWGSPLAIASDLMSASSSSACAMSPRRSASPPTAGRHTRLLVAPSAGASIPARIASASSQRPAGISSIEAVEICM